MLLIFLCIFSHFWHIYIYICVYVLHVKMNVYICVYVCVDGRTNNTYSHSSRSGHNQVWRYSKVFVLMHTHTLLNDFYKLKTLWICGDDMCGKWLSTCSNFKNISIVVVLFLTFARLFIYITIYRCVRVSHGAIFPSYSSLSLPHWFTLNLCTNFNSKAKLLNNLLKTNYFFIWISVHTQNRQCVCVCENLKEPQHVHYIYIYINTYIKASSIFTYRFTHMYNGNVIPSLLQIMIVFRSQMSNQRTAQRTINLFLFCKFHWCNQIE